MEWKNKEKMSSPAAPNNYDTHCHTNKHWLVYLRGVHMLQPAT